MTLSKDGTDAVPASSHVSNSSSSVVIPNPQVDHLLQKLSLQPINRVWCASIENVSSEQSMLNILLSVLQSSLKSPNFDEVLQTIKTHFFHRRFLSVFNNPQHLSVYVLRYVPTRVLAYYDFFRKCGPITKLLQRNAVVCCLGSGSTSELNSLCHTFAALLYEESAERSISLVEIKRRLIVHIQDLFDWSSIQRPILNKIRVHCGLSNDRLVVSFDQSDLLDPYSSRFKLANKCHLVTLMFVLNELFAESRIKALKFLTQLVETMQIGSMLLVLDSASDFSQLNSKSDSNSIKLQTELWMYHLLDSLNGLKTLAKNDAQWFRISGCQLGNSKL